MEDLFVAGLFLKSTSSIFGEKIQDAPHKTSWGFFENVCIQLFFMYKEPFSAELIFDELLLLAEILFLKGTLISP